MEAGDLPDSTNNIKLYFIEQDGTAPFDSLFVCDQIMALDLVSKL